MDLDRVMTTLNPAIVWILRSPLHPLLSAALMLITVTGRRSGRRYTIPVGYQRDGARFTILVSKARRKNWWRNYLDPRPAELHVHGRTLRGRAWVVPDDSEEFRDAIEATFHRLPFLGQPQSSSSDLSAGVP